MSLSYTIDMIAIIKRFILFLLRTFRRALCCFSRKRLESDSQRDVHLEIVNVINDNQQFNKNLSVPERDWNSWDDKPRTVEEHIEVYRESLVKPKELEPVDEIESLDLFEDMAPKIVKQKKVYLGGEEQVNFSRLEASVAAEIPITNELEDWDEDNQQPAGWDEINDQNTKQLIRDKRKELRAAKYKSSHSTSTR